MPKPGTSSKENPLAEEIPAPIIPGYALLRCIGRGSYGEVWLARDSAGSYRAVKVVYRRELRAGSPL